MKFGQFSSVWPILRTVSENFNFLYLRSSVLKGHQTRVFITTHPLRTDILRMHQEAFLKDSVVPDVIDQAPANLLKITYTNLKVNPGDVLTPTQAHKEPSLEWEADANSFYTVIMNDPDAPSRANPKFREYHHWMVGNIPGNDVSKGEVLSGYVGAGPPKGTGLHRYVFLVFKQQGKDAFKDLPRIPNTSGKLRPKQSVLETAAKYNLGHAISGNYFQAEYDSYCEELYKQLKD